MNDSALDQASQMFNALGHPTRLAIMERLSCGAEKVQDLADALELPQPTISQHLKVLRLAALVNIHPHGRERLYSITDEHVAHIVRDAIRHAGEEGPLLDE